MFKSELSCIFNKSLSYELPVQFVVILVGINVLQQLATRLILNEAFILICTSLNCF